MNKFFSSLIILLSITFVGCTSTDFQNFLLHGSSFNKKNEPSYLQDETFLKYEKSCNNNEAQGCHDLFLFFFKVRDAQQTIRYGERACNMGHADSCLYMGGIFMNGDKRISITKNLVKGKLYLEKGCDYQSLFACQLLGLAYATERIGVKNYNLAKNFFEKGCKLEVEYEQKGEYRHSLDKYLSKFKSHFDACGFLAYLYFDGFGTNKHNPEQSKIYADKSCNFDYGPGCAIVGAYYYDKRNAKQSQIYFDKACNLGYKLTCNVNVAAELKRDAELEKYNNARRKQAEYFNAMFRAALNAYSNITRRNSGK